MKTCLDCIHYERCDNVFDGLLSNRDNKPCKQFDDKLFYAKLPCYLGQKMWYPRAWYNFNDEEVRSELYEGKVSMLQQKADGSWKIRVSTRWELDYKVEDIGKDVFLTREAAEADLNKKIKFLKEKYNLE